VTGVACQIVTSIHDEAFEVKFSVTFRKSGINTTYINFFEHGGFLWTVTCTGKIRRVYVIEQGPVIYMHAGAFT